MATLVVGTGSLATLMDAVNAAQNGDTIQLPAGIYQNNFAGIAKNITIEGTGSGRAWLQATALPPNGKGILVTNGNITLRNLEFSGSAVTDENGAGIRYETGNLIIDNCYFHDNENGILAAASATGTITISNSEFGHNGNGDGQTHNLYVNKIATLTITDSYFHDAVVGHEIKSRADTTIIRNNTIVDGSTGTASYSIDVPNGGNVTIEGNFIEQGPASENTNIIHFGGEPPEYPASSLLIRDNVFRNDLAGGSGRLLLHAASASGTFVDNRVYGLTAAQITDHPERLTQSGTVFLADPPPIPCFVAGTRIATPDGEVLVQDLVIGDTVLTLSGTTEAIVWIGVGRVQVIPGQRCAGTPVWVRKGALADNVPHHDLRLTSAHSLYFEGMLIPVECLVNHRSILWDDLAREIDIYHIELAHHDVLLAEGAPAESYREDGNRWLFRNARRRQHSVPAEACAPVLTSGPEVDAIWRRLLDRAGPRSGLPTTDDPDLHLLVDGLRLDGRPQADGVHWFCLPARPGSLRIVSRAGVPCELGFSRDPRALGVALRRVLMRYGTRMQLIEASAPSLEQGFHAFEATDGFRWTNGDAELPPTLFDGVDGACELELHISYTAHYPLL